MPEQKLNLLEFSAREVTQPRPAPTKRVEVRDFGAPGWQDAHRDLYIRTDGAEGHLVDFSRVGASAIHAS